MFKPKCFVGKVTPIKVTCILIYKTWLYTTNIINFLWVKVFYAYTMIQSINRKYLY